MKFGTLMRSLVMTAMVFAGCDINNPADNVKVLFNEDPLTMIAVEIVDARSTEQIAAPDSVRLVIEGSSRHLVTDATEKSRTSFASVSGYFTIAIAAEAVISPESPFEITLKASAPDYIAASKPLTIVSESGLSVIMTLVKRSNPPEGITSTTVREGDVDDSGVVDAPVSYSSESDPETGASSTVSIESGTVIRDETGTPLTGELTASVTYFNVQSSNTIDAIPGGLVTTVRTTDATTNSVLVPAGMVSLDIVDASGHSASTFDTPVGVSFQIPPDVVNPATGAAVVPGETIPVWRYDDDRSDWLFIADGAVSGPETNGNYTVTFSVDHFSYYLAAWMDTTSTVCDSGTTITLTGGYSAVDMLVKKVSDGTYYSSYRTSVDIADPVVRLATVPVNVPVLVEAWYGAQKVGSVAVDNLCGAEVTLPVTIPGKKVTFSVDVYDAADPTQRMRPSRAIYIGENDTRKYVGYMKDGHITIYGLTEGVEYMFWVFHEDMWYSDVYVIGPESLVELEFAVET